MGRTVYKQDEQF